MGLQMRGVEGRDEDDHEQSENRVDVWFEPWRISGNFPLDKIGQGILDRGSKYIKQSLYMKNLI